MSRYNISTETAARTADLKTSTDISKYKDYERCVILLRPYRNVPLNIWDFENDVYDIPNYIQEVMSEINDKDIDVAIHYRYNENDWANRCKPNHSKSDSTECQVMKKIDHKT